MVLIGRIILNTLQSFPYPVHSVEALVSFENQNKHTRAPRSCASLFSTTVSGSEAIDEMDGDTAVERRCFAPEARSAGEASLRGQTTVGWRGRGPRGQEKRTRGAPLRGYVVLLISQHE